MNPTIEVDVGRWDGVRQNAAVSIFARRSLPGNPGWAEHPDLVGEGRATSPRTPHARGPWRVGAPEKRAPPTDQEGSGRWVNINYRKCRKQGTDMKTIVRILGLAWFSAFCGAVAGVAAEVAKIPEAPGQAGKPGSGNSRGREVLQFEIRGTHCEGCARGIASELKRVPGVVGVEVSHPKRRALVTVESGRVDEARVVSVVKEAGYEAVPVSRPAGKTRRP